MRAFDSDDPNVSQRDEALADGGVAGLKQLRQLRGKFETWSRFPLEGEGPDSETEIALRDSSGGRGKCPW